MPFTLTVRDETTAGDRSDAITLEFPTEHITVRELIRERIYQEVEDYNRHAGTKVFRGLVEPSDAEKTLNGVKLPRERRIDWKAQFEKACEAFEKSRVLVLVGDHQAESLDETVTLTRGVEVSFLKLVPLVGG